MDKNENMLIRKYLNNLDTFYNQTYKTNYINTNISKEYIKSYLYNYFLTDKLDFVIERVMKAMKFKDEEFRMHKTQTFLVSIILIQDAYITLNYEQVTGKSTKEHEKLFNLVNTAINDEKTSLLIDNIDYILGLVDNSLNILNASALDKVAFISSLDEDDIDKLSKFNPFFKQEFDYYNIDITEEFMLKHLRIWINKSGEKVALEKLSQFFIDMSYADDDKIDNFFQLLLNYTDEETLVNLISNEDIEGISAIVKQFYEDRKARELKK